mmetsp:Transcript_39302/g.77316  ORF Transcript_39302/g.77316 Transcript_39302/m.77316 type:complete len:255 (-) Transcript_39302:1159-1923(-)
MLEEVRSSSASLMVVMVGWKVVPMARDKSRELTFDRSVLCRSTTSSRTGSGSDWEILCCEGRNALTTSEVDDLGLLRARLDLRTPSTGAAMHTSSSAPLLRKRSYMSCAALTCSGAPSTHGICLYLLTAMQNKAFSSAYRSRQNSTNSACTFSAVLPSLFRIQDKIVSASLLSKVSRGANVTWIFPPTAFFNSFNHLSLSSSLTAQKTVLLRGFLPDFATVVMEKACLIVSKKLAVVLASRGMDPTGFLSILLR